MNSAEPIQERVKKKATHLEQGPVQPFLDRARSQLLIFALEVAQTGLITQNVLNNLSRQVALLPDLQP